MRLKQYINEESDDFIEIIKRDCKPFIDEFTSNNIILFRGTKKKIDVIERMQRRNDRRPKDLPIELHDILDKIFKKKFGWKARSQCVFASSNHIGIKVNYGTPYFFFPIGKYRYTFCKGVDDIFDLMCLIKIKPNTQFMFMKYTQI
jgi:hypothetical protein